jgi:hypothetical protein
MNVKLSVFLSIAAVASGAMLYEPVTATLKSPAARSSSTAPPPAPVPAPAPQPMSPLPPPQPQQPQPPNGAFVQQMAFDPLGTANVPPGSPPPYGYLLIGNTNTPPSTWRVIYLPAPAPR